MNEQPIAPDKCKLSMEWPNPKLTGYTTYQSYLKCAYSRDATGPHLTVDLSDAKAIISREGLTPRAKITFIIEYVPKPAVSAVPKRT
jgi:hypothetical protein